MAFAIPIPNHPRFQDITGHVFGKLTVTGYAGTHTHGTNSWICMCECGTEKVIRRKHLLSGQVISCGCAKGTHKRHGTPEYHVWSAMIQRCTNPKNPAFKNYGGRGIKVCERWMTFENFFADMGERTTPNHQLDRIDNNGPYAPWNCRWATKVEQTRNTRRAIVLEFNGVKKNLKEWSEETGIHYVTLTYRLRRGWSVEETLTTPKQIYKKKSPPQ